MSAGGAHLRYVPGAMATAMVSGGAARVDTPGIGRIRSVILSRPAESFAQRIGEASEPSLGGVKFYRWRRLDDSATRIIEHHPRCYW